MSPATHTIFRYLLTALLLCGIGVPVSGHMPLKKMPLKPTVCTSAGKSRPATDFDGLVPNVMLF